MRKSQYSPKKRASKKSPLKRIIFTGLFFCLLAGLIYFFIWSPVIWIEKIDVRPSSPIISIKEIVQNNLEGKIWQFVPQKSIILVPLNKIKEDILDSSPEIKEVSIRKKIPQFRPRQAASLEIIIEERKSIGLWCQIEEPKIAEQLSEELLETEEATSTESAISESVIKQCFYLDKEGIIFRESPLISGSFVLNIFSSKKESVLLGEEVVSPEMIDFILKTAQGLSLKIDSFEIVSPEDLRVKTSQGWQIYFNPTYSADWQINALEMILEEEIKEKINSLEYIDLRIEGRVYYK